MDFWNSPEYRLLRIEIERYSSSVESVEFLDELQTREAKKNLEIRASQGDPLTSLFSLVIHESWMISQGYGMFKINGPPFEGKELNWERLRRSGVWG